jgi:hypothetical protein
MRTTSNRPLAAALAVAALGLAATPAAHAQLAATVTPNRAGSAARLHWQLDGTAAPVGGLIPASLVFTTPPGFTLDTRAVAKRCTKLQSKLDECPAKSRLGSGQMIIHVDKPGGPRDLPIPITLYLGKKKALLAVAFLAGVRVVPGSISDAHGIRVTFDPLPVPPVIPQVSYRFVGVSLDLGVTRRVKHRVKRHGRHHHKRKVKIVRYKLVHTGPCTAGSWPLSTTVGLPGGTSALLAAPVACKAG